MSLPRIGWVGLGRIGMPMARRLADGGFAVTAWARSGSPPGAPFSAALSPEALAAQSEVVCTVLTGSADVQQLQQRMMPAARPGTLFIDFTTAAPSVAARSQALAAQHGLMALDAPVTGGVAGAAKGSLTLFVGGSSTALEAAHAVLARLGERTVPCGEAGSGYRMKLINQVLVAGNLLGLAEAARLARGMGLAEDAVPQALASGTAGSFLLGSYWARMFSGQGAVTFSLALLAKDLQLALDEAASLGLPLPQVTSALLQVHTAIKAHGPQAGVQVLAQ